MLFTVAPAGIPAIARVLDTPALLLFGMARAMAPEETVVLVPLDTDKAWILPWQRVALAGVIVTLPGEGLTTMVFESLTVPHNPPEVVSINVAVPVYPAGGVQVAFSVVAFGLNVPPAAVDQVPPVAEPPTVPPNAADVPPWQIAAKAAPALTVGARFTTWFLLSVAVHEVPVVVSVSTAVPLNPAGAVQVAFSVVAFGLKVPPAGVDHIPPVAEPPTTPLNPADVPPWQIAPSGPPALAVETFETTTVLLANTDPQLPPVVVNVSVAVPVYPGGGVQVALSVFAFGLNVPPAGVDHVPPVAPLPTEPPKAAVVPPLQIPAMAGPALTVGKALTVYVDAFDVTVPRLFVNTARNLYPFMDKETGFIVSVDEVTLLAFVVTTEYGAAIVSAE